MRTFLIIFAALLLMITIAARSWALPVEVSYTVTGSGGEWLLDFSFSNQMQYTIPGQNAPANMNLYKVGVLLDPLIVIRSSIAGPPHYQPASPESLAAFPEHSGFIYNVTWQYDLGPNACGGCLWPQSTVSGFQVEVRELRPPLGAYWFALGQSTGGHYLGDDCIGCSVPTGTIGERLPRFGTASPGFEGLAQGTLVSSTEPMTSPSSGSVPAPVPEPSTWLLLGTGLIGLAAWRYRLEV